MTSFKDNSDLIQRSYLRWVIWIHLSSWLMNRPPPHICALCLAATIATYAPIPYAINICWPPFVCTHPEVLQELKTTRIINVRSRYSLTFPLLILVRIYHLIKYIMITQHLWKDSLSTEKSSFSCKPNRHIRIDAVCTKSMTSTSSSRTNTYHYY